MGMLEKPYRPEPEGRPDISEPPLPGHTLAEVLPQQGSPGQGEADPGSSSMSVEERSPAKRARRPHGKTEQR